MTDAFVDMFEDLDFESSIDMGSKREDSEDKDLSMVFVFDWSIMGSCFPSYSQINIMTFKAL